MPAEPSPAPTPLEQLYAVVLANASLSATEKAALLIELTRQTAMPGPVPLQIVRPGQQ